MNRLKLDWALSTSTERNAFIQQYINQPPFISTPLNEEELETIANYILWGKNENDKNLDQDGYIELPRKNSTWSTQNIESLDELTESPTFNETSIYSLNTKTTLKKTREVFSRKEARAQCPSSLLYIYESLWKEIDKTELTINYYELLHEKRIKPPRADLLNSLNEEEQVECADRAKNLNQFKYLKLRHLLVELRREQYTLKDSFNERILLRAPIIYQEEEISPSFNSEIQVFPFGTTGAPSTSSLIFQPFSQLIPVNFNEEQLIQLSNFYWMKQEEKKKSIDKIDFTDLDTVYQIFLLMEELEETEETIYSSTKELINTLKYYIKETNLPELQKEILQLKIRKEKNQDIALYINKKYNKSYTANYISTIFRQKIIPAINETVKYHEKIIQNLFFKEEFKVCIKCGQTLLRDPINFVRKSRAKDGLSNRCKCCDKKDREEKKIKEVKIHG